MHSSPYQMIKIGSLIQIKSFKLHLYLAYKMFDHLNRANLRSWWRLGSANRYTNSIGMVHFNVTRHYLSGSGCCPHNHHQRGFYHPWDWECGCDHWSEDFYTSHLEGFCFCFCFFPWGCHCTLYLAHHPVFEIWEKGVGCLHQVLGCASWPLYSLVQGSMTCSHSQHFALSSVVGILIGWKRTEDPDKPKYSKWITQKSSRTPYYVWYEKIA